MTKRRRFFDRLGIAALLVGLACGAAGADETVDVGGSRAVLIRPNAPRGSVILLPGGDGAIRAGDHGDIHGLLGNQLVRTRQAYAARGLAVLVADAGTDLKSAVDYMAAIKRPVTVIGTSRGTLRAAQGIARGARPDALVLTSGFLSRRVRQQRKRDGDPGLPGSAAAHARHPSSGGFLPGDIAGGSRSLHQMVGREGARRLAFRRHRSGRPLRSLRPSRLQRSRWPGRRARRRLSVVPHRLAPHRASGGDAAPHAHVHIKSHGIPAPTPLMLSP